MLHTLNMERTLNSIYQILPFITFQPYICIGDLIRKRETENKNVRTFYSTLGQFIEYKKVTHHQKRWTVTHSSPDWPNLLSQIPIFLSVASNRWKPTDTYPEGKMFFYSSQFRSIFNLSYWLTKNHRRKSNSELTRVCAYIPSFNLKIKQHRWKLIRIKWK